MDQRGAGDEPGLEPLHRHPLRAGGRRTRSRRHRPADPPPAWGLRRAADACLPSARSRLHGHGTARHQRRWLRTRLGADVPVRGRHRGAAHDLPLLPGDGDLRHRQLRDLARDPLALGSGCHGAARLGDLRGQSRHQPVPNPPHPLRHQRLLHGVGRRLHDPLQRRHLDLGLRLPTHHRPAGDDRDRRLGHVRGANPRRRDHHRPRPVPGCAGRLPGSPRGTDPGRDRRLRATRPLADHPQDVRPLPGPGAAGSRGARRADCGRTSA